MTNCCPENNVLSESTLKEIEKLVGKEVSFVVAFDKQANPTILRSATARECIQDISEDNPLKNEGITKIQSATFGTYRGSTCIYWVQDGKSRSFCF